jgi:hypothetical protein
LLASQTTRLHRHTALANKFAPTEGRGSRPSRYSMWERTCPRRRCFRRQTPLGCTGLFADKSAPTGTAPNRLFSDVFNVGADLPAKAMFQAADTSRMYRPLRGQVRSHGICAKPTVPRRISVGDNLLASQTTRLRRHTALANKFAPTEGRGSRPSPHSMWERTCPRRRCFRRQTPLGCTGLFADKSAPTGSAPNRLFSDGSL